MTEKKQEGLPEISKPASKLDYHFETMGRILAHLVSNGVRKVNLGSADAMGIMTYREGDESEVLATFRDAIDYLIAEGLVRADNRNVSLDGRYKFLGVQLTGAGVKAVQVPHTKELGGSIAETVESPKTKKDSSFYQKIGELIGGVVKGALDM
jgi:hypothetical protein